MSMQELKALRFRQAQNPNLDGARKYIDTNSYTCVYICLYIAFTFYVNIYIVYMYIILYNIIHNYKVYAVLYFLTMHSHYNQHCDGLWSQHLGLICLASSGPVLAPDLSAAVFLLVRPALYVYVHMSVPTYPAVNNVVD